MRVLRLVVVGLMFVAAGLTQAGEAPNEGERQTAADFIEFLNAVSGEEVPEDFSLVLDPEELSDALSGHQKAAEAAQAEPVDVGPARRAQDGAVVHSTADVFPYREFNPADGTATLDCVVGWVCSIDLEPGEFVVSEQGPVLVDERWSIREIATGTGQRTLAFSPAEWGISTNVIFATNERVYSLRLRSAERGKGVEHPLTERARFRYRAGWKQDAAPRPVIEPVAPVGAAGCEAKVHNARYEVQKPRRFLGIGRKPIRWRPVAVWDDGERMYIRLPSEAEQLPAVRGVFDGSAYQLNSSVEGDVITIESLPGAVELLSGSRQLTIKRDSKAAA